MDPPPLYSGYNDPKSIQDGYDYSMPLQPALVEPPPLFQPPPPLQSQPPFQHPTPFQSPPPFQNPTPFQYPPHHQQQQQVILLQSQPRLAPSVRYNPHPVSMNVAVLLSCIAFWLFGFIFGAIAFILAMVGGEKSFRNDISGAIRLRNASYVVSAVGIGIGIIAVAVVIAYVRVCSNATSTGYEYYRRCF